MNILIVQENGRKSINRHMRECYSLEHWLNKEEGVSAVCWGKGHENFSTPFPDIAAQHDVILCLENYNNGWLPDMSKTKCYKAFWSIDSHCELKAHIKFCSESKVNLHLNATKGYLKHFSPHCETVAWFPNAADTRWFKKTSAKKSNDIGFVGSMIADRPQLIPFLEKTVGLKSYSNVLGEDMVELLNSFKISFNKCISDDINYRIFESTACGLPLITNKVPDLEHLFVLDEDIAIYSNVKEMLGVCLWLLKDETARDQIAENGYKRTLENHTYKHRAHLLKEILSNA